MPDFSQPQSILLPDAGLIPNSHLPLLLYRSMAPDRRENLAAWFEQTFMGNNWGNNWRNGIFPYHHYHSTTHEVLGIYSGSGTVQVGGESGPDLIVGPGDVLVIPAGVGHRARWHSPDFGVAGGYPDGRNWDLLRGLPGERPQSDQTIASVPLPATDPLYGAAGPLIRHWG